MKHTKYSIELDHVVVDYYRSGKGNPIVYIHPELGLIGSDEFVNSLSAGGDVICPIIPGYSNRARPADIDTVDDVAYLFLSLLEILDLRDVHLVGVSLGAWIAAEMATKSNARISRISLVSPIGIRPEPAITGELFDIFSIHWSDFEHIAFLDKSKIPTLDSSSSDQEFLDAALSREATALYAWQPYMNNPKLKGRLSRIRVPTRFIRADSDQFASREYVELFCSSVPNATLSTINGAGHYVHVEKPSELSTLIFA